MAVRFDADGESYSRSTGLGVVTDWTVACWAKLAADRAATTVIWQIDNGSGTSRLRINVWNGTAITFQTDSGGWFGLAGHTMVVGEWTYIGLSSTSNPGLARVRIRPANTAAFVGGTPSQANVTFNAATLRIGAGQEASSWLNGSVAAVKVWNAALTMDELELESWTYLPYRTNSLTAWYPFLTASAVDYSGNAQTLSGGTGAATDDGPPISWSTGRHRRSIAAPDPVTGTLAGILPAATATSASVVKVAGTLAGTLPAATADFAGAVNTNYLAGVLPAATASMAGAVEVSGTAAATLPAATASMVGEVEIPTKDISPTSSGPVRGWKAAPPDRAWAAGPAVRGWKAGPPTT